MSIHWGCWATATILLLAAVPLFVQWRRRKQRWWALASVLTLLLGLGSFAVGWHAWPSQTAEQFTALAYHGQFEKLNRYLPESLKWQVGADGSVTIRAEDGSTATLSPDSMPLAAAETNRPTSSQRWAGRWSFALASLGPRTYKIYCTAEYGKVYCHRIERVEEPK